MTEGVFLQDLAIVMAVAGVVAVVFTRFGWPKVLGYILAGIVLGEYTWGGSFLTDIGSTRTIGQLGVVFLMFGMGLSFSARDLAKIRFVALPSAILDTLVMIWLGYMLGTRVFGWASAPSLFLGVAICDSATTLLAKVIGEMGWSRRVFAKYVLGTSVCEDIICVGAIAVATGFAQGDGLSAGAFVASLAGLALFFLSVLVFGCILVPRMLLSTAKRNDDESLVLALLGFCFFVTFLAYRLNYSLALGAFLVGLIGASSEVRERLARLMDPLKSMFSAVFFVSIGLLIDPVDLWAHLPQILLVSVVVIVGKFLNNFIASLLAGLEIKTAVQNAFGLAQIGEFAFLVALLYADRDGEVETAMFPIAVGVSLLTTLANPFLLRVSDAAGMFAERIVSRRIREGLESYRTLLEKLRASTDRPALVRLRTLSIKLGIYAVLMLAISVSFAMLSRYDYTRFSATFERHDALVFFVVANILTITLLPMVLVTARALGDELALLLIGEGDSKWQLHARQIVRLVILGAVAVAFVAFWIMENEATRPQSVWARVLSLSITLLSGVLGWRFFVKAGRRASQRLMEALTAEERREGLAKTLTITIPAGKLQRLRLDANSPAIGGTVATLNIRAKTGAFVMSVRRNGQEYRNIGPEWEFAIGDELLAVGESQQVAALKDLLGVTA